MAALEPWAAQTRDRSATVTQDDKEAPQIQLVEQRLVTVWERWPDAFALGRTIPLCGSRYRATIGTKADQDGVLPVPFAHQLPDVQFPAWPISVARASPRCELCAHTTILAGCPCPCR